MRKTFLLMAFGAMVAVIVFAFVSKSASADLASGLVAYYPFNGNANDESGNGNHGIPYGATPTEDRFGNPDSAYSLNRVTHTVGDYIEIPVNINPDIMPQATIIVWAKSNAIYPSAAQAVFTPDNYGWDRGIWHWYDYGWGVSNGSGILGGHHVIINEWTFLAVIYDQDNCTVKFYVNDSLYESDGCTDLGTTFTTIGRTPYMGGYFDGTLDDIRIYNRILSANEVEELYEQFQPSPPDIESGLVAYYPFNGNANDESGYGNHGIVYGADLIADKFGNPNSAYNFTRVSDIAGDDIEIPVNINPDVMPQITITAWVKENSLTTDAGQCVISNDNYGWDRSIYNWYDDGWGAVNGSGLVGYHPVTVHEWIFLAVTYDQVACIVKFYANDFLYEGTGCQGLGNTYTNIGSTGHNTAHFDGVIDEVRIYNRILSAEEIAELAEIPEPPQSFSFIHITDPHLGSNWVPGHKWREELSYPRFTDGLYEIGEMGEKPDFILMSGDIVEYAKTKWLKDYQSIVNSFTAQTSIPVYTIPGNHDRYKGATGNARCRFPLNNSCEDDLHKYKKFIDLPGPGLDEDNYLNPGNPVDYQFTHKGMRFIGLDSGGDYLPDYEWGDAGDQGAEGSGLAEAQINALEQMDPLTPKIVFLHHPVITSYSDFCDDEECPSSTVEDASFVHYYNEFLHLATSSNVQLALAGHTHESHVFDIEDTEYMAEPPEDIRPLFIQTQSATKDGETNHGYREVLIENNWAYPRLPTTTGLHPKVVGRLNTDDNLTFRVYDPNNPANFITMKDIDGLSVPHFVASSSKRVMIYDIGDNDSKFAVAGRSDGQSSGYDLEARLEGEAIAVSPYAGNTGFYTDNSGEESFLSILVDADSDLAKIDLKHMALQNLDVHQMLIDWSELIDNGVNGVILQKDMGGDGSFKETIGFAWMSDSITARISGLAELLVIDGLGRITGTINGEVYEEIPYALYDEENDQVIIYLKDGYQNQKFYYQVTGLEDVFGDMEDAYNLALTLRRDSGETAFNAVDIPASASSTHQYAVDWEKLMAGDDGVVLRTDNDGDGVFEQSIISDQELTAEEYSAYSPRRIRELIKLDLEQAKTGDNQIDRKIDEVLKHIDNGLTEEWWLDDYHLDPNKGKKVFRADAKAVGKIRWYLGMDKIFRNKKHVPALVKQKFVLPDEVSDIFARAILDLVSADRILARIATDEANARDDLSWRQKRMIARAEKAFARAEQQEEKHPVMAVHHYGTAWEFAGKAMR